MPLPKISFQPLSSEHLPAVLAIEAETLGSLVHLDQLRRNSSDMLAACLREPHFTLGAFCGAEIAAFATLYVPQPGDDEDLSQCLSASIVRTSAANFKICIVRPQYRGQGLQVQLGRQLEREASRRGIRLLCATVSPRNEASVRSLIHLGYHYDASVQKYGFARDLYYHCIEQQ